MMVSIRKALLTLAVLIAPTATMAGTITYTGLELATLSGVTFPTAAPVTSGSSIQFTAGARSKLLSLDLFSAGELSGQLPTSLSIEVNFTRLSNDFDPFFLLSDGGKMAGGGVFDNGGGGSQFLTLDDQGTLGNLLSATFVDGLGYPGVGQADTLKMDFGFAGNILSQTNTFRGTVTSHTYASELLNFSLPITFVLLADNETEQYQINSIGITTPDVVQVNEPSIALMFALTLAGLISARGRSMPTSLKLP